MSLEVWTARISSADPDRFDITRGSGGQDGAPFAPSWAILKPALEARNAATFLRRGPGKARPGALVQSAEADAIEDAAWAVYVEAYRAEMRASYRQSRAAWDALLGRSRVALVCFCTEPARCHRTLLAGILGKLGADVRGELPALRRAS
jgi:hypothetical protein